LWVLRCAEALDGTLNVFSAADVTLQRGRDPAGRHPLAGMGVPHGECD
jgi:hypothetical protein